MSAFLDILWSTDNAVLPSATAMRVALHLLWAIVLGSGALLIAGNLALPYRLVLSVLVIAWTLMPGAMSPAHWLGLAFQTPSLMSGAICLVWFLRQARQAPGTGVSMAGPRLDALAILAWVGVVLGWVLLLDTLAWLPVSIYAWGFSTAAFGTVLVFAMLLWVLFGATGSNRKASRLAAFVLPLLVLTLFLLTRLPTGNVWDALLDPWLWGVLQLGWLVSAARRLTVGGRASPATRV
ncbi:hypothetical protein [Rhodoferax sp.]|uniref:hypothetical protein n=1 Tax=Rhodoferax sp. TaxID=50421 RepID=UPI002716AB9B|nr:hypothetical protein [Rhodoferax sp.]MDO9197238.1 hypothetical protein [Rhodoferax sp.]